MKTLCFPLLLLAPISSPGGDFELTLHEIDRSIREGDGLSLADVDGDGQNNPVLSTGNGGQVYWYEKHGPSEWTRHLIAEGFTEIEGTVATDFDGDGKIEVVFFDQATRKPPGLVVLAKQDGEDPRGSWSTVILDDVANHTQQGLVFDITGDGNPDFFYSYEGRGADDGGFVGLHTYEYGTWKRTALSDLHTAAVRGYDITRDGIDEIIAMDRTTHQMQLWVLDREVGSYALEANHDFIKGDDYVGFDDIDGDGEIREFFIGSDPQGLFWFKVTVPE